MSKALIFCLLLVSCYMSSAQKQNERTSFFIEQEQDVGTQQKVAVTVKNTNALNYSFDTLLQLKALAGYDADQGKQSLYITGIEINDNNHGARKIKLSGTLKLECCFGVIARVDLLDARGKVLGSSNTDDKGHFTLIAEDGTFLTESRKELALAFDKISVFDITGKKHLYRIRKLL